MWENGEGQEGSATEYADHLKCCKSLAELKFSSRCHLIAESLNCRIPITQNRTLIAVDAGKYAMKSIVVSEEN